MLNPENERDLFCQAIEIENPQEREVFLKQNCAGNASLYEQVSGLLAEHYSDTEGLVERMLFNPVGDGLDPLQRGSVLGPYTLENLLGEGGMGQVWVANQNKPIRRRVAIKLIRSGRETPGVMQRFEVERQALASMDHPNIARVLDAGTTVDRRPYFVMELVNGAGLIQFCDEAKLDIRSRLHIFLQATRAVQHAHQKAIIHRDIKPSNILVTMIDGKPVPKIIDFGLAKALTGSLTDDTVNTQFGTVMGTLQYMAPEQANYSGQDVDTRADVYSLGVLLYESLTGLQPFGNELFDQVTVEEKFRIVREQDPPLPSTRLSSSGSASSFAGLRQTEPELLSNLLRYELDWVVMKALEKDRNQRYQSASDFADDIERYLNGEPVEAHPPSRTYRIKKFIRKNSGLVATVALIATSMLIGIAGISYGLVKSNINARLLMIEMEKTENAMKAALREKTEAVAARNLAIESAAAEQRQRQFADSVTDFLRKDILELTSVRRQFKLNDFLAGKTPIPIPGKDATLTDLLDRAAETIGMRPNLAPHVEAELKGIIGVSYRQMGQPQKALEFLESSAEIFVEIGGDESEKSISASNSLSVAYSYIGRHEQAIMLNRRVLELSKNVHGNAHAKTLEFMMAGAKIFVHAGKFEEALEMANNVLQINSKNPSDSRIEDSAFDVIAATLIEKNELELALKLVQSTLELQRMRLPDNHPGIIGTINAIAVIHLKSGNYFEATTRLSEVATLSNKVLGQNDRTTLLARKHLAQSHLRQGRPDEALPILKDTWIRFAESLGIEHHLALSTSNALACAFRDTKRFEEAIELFHVVLSTNAMQSPETQALVRLKVETLNNLAITHGQTGDVEKTKSTYRELIKFAEQNDQVEDAIVLSIMNASAATYFRLGEIDLATSVFERLLPRIEQEFGEEDPRYFAVLRDSIQCYLLAEKPRKANELLKQANPLADQKFGKTHDRAIETLRQLASSESVLGNYEMACQSFQELHARTVQKYGDEHVATLRAAIDLASAYRKAGQIDQALPVLETLLDRARAAFDIETLEFATFLDSLSFQLFECHEFQDAETVLREGLSVRQDHAPNDWETYRTQSRLGEILLRQDQFVLARPILLESYAGMKARKAQIPAKDLVSLNEAVDRLIDLFKADNDPAELKKWQAERQTLD